MAITASTSYADTRVRAVAPKSLFESALSVISSSSTWYRGDIVCFDTSSKILRVVSATTDSANVCGMAKQSISSGKPISPYQGTAVDAAVAIQDIAGPEYGTVWGLKVKTGDSLVKGCKVYLADGQDSQTVTVSDPGDGNHIGIYQGGTATAAAGVRYPVLVGARYNLAGFSV